MKKLRTILAAIAILAFVVPVSTTGFQLASEPKETNRGSFVVIMEDPPAISYEGDVKELSATKAGIGGTFDAKSASVQRYAKFLEAKNNLTLRAVGADASNKIYDYTIALTGFAAVLTKAQAADMAKQPGVRMVLRDTMKYPTTDSVGRFLGLSRRGGAWLKGYTGEDVVVGIIDTGIWPEHPSFADDGSYGPSPIDPIPCEFGTAHNPIDAPFTCNNKLIGARQMLDTYRVLIGIGIYADPDEYDSARDDSGHGTHTASTAAGNAGVEASIYGIPRGAISGVAPRARVVAYKGLGKLGGFTSDLAAAIDQAVADGVDVINYSIGGGAAEPAADEIAFLFAAEAGVYVATSAGNAGPEPASLGNPGTMPWLTTVGANTQRRFFKGAVVLGDGCDDSGADNNEIAKRGHGGHRKCRYYGASITAGTDRLPIVDAASATVDGDDRCFPGTLDEVVVAGRIVLCRRGGSARADKSRAVWLADGAGMIMYNNSDDDNLATDSHWVPSVHIDQTPGLEIKAFIAAAKKPMAKIRGGRVSKWPPAPSMTIFSSRGPNPIAGDIIKPDITAPGTQILAGYSPTSYDEYDLPGGLFAAIQGTSMSSPIVAGVFALLKQAHGGDDDDDGWTPAMAKSAMMTTTYQDVVDNDRVSPADPFDMGAGHVDPRKVTKGSIFQPGLVYDAGLFEYAAFTCGMDWGVFTPGSCDFLESIGVPSEPYNLNYPSIGIAELAGSMTVTRTVTSVAEETRSRKYKVSVDAPEGYEVTVSPSTISLAPGDTASYQVTITDVGAPIGEWRFGSLTWKSGRYKAYSPIAVRGVLLGAPAETFGSGDSGSASFEVRFGYTGSYAAAPHGLVVDAPTSGDIGQDPDQTYPSVDDSPVGVQKIDYPIASAAFVRWEMVIPGDDDIDLFLEDSTGTIIASSTSGGTDELIELFLPADDTYTMVVHGGSVPSAPLPYTLSHWQVPLASGGSLSVDSAPTSAELGATGTIDVSWGGLDPGRHLGAVSHTGDTGLMGLTLVDVKVENP